MTLVGVGYDESKQVTGSPNGLLIPNQPIIPQDQDNDDSEVSSIHLDSTLYKVMVDI